MNEKIYSVEWDGKRPFSVVVLSTETYLDIYDVDYCKRDNQLYYHQSGGMPVDGKQEGLEKLPLGVETMQDLIEHFGIINEETETMWCEICQDRFPVDNLCSHIEWNDEEGIYEGEGCID